MKKYILSIDSGTTGITVLLINKELKVVQKEYSELALSSIRKLNDCNAKNSLETLVMLTKTKV